MRLCEYVVGGDDHQILAAALTAGDGGQLVGFDEQREMVLFISGDQVRP